MAMTPKKKTLKSQKLVGKRLSERLWLRLHSLTIVSARLKRPQLGHHSSGTRHRYTWVPKRQPAEPRHKNTVEDLTRSDSNLLNKQTHPPKDSLGVQSIHWGLRSSYRTFKYFSNFFSSAGGSASRSAVSALAADCMNVTGLKIWKSLGQNIEKIWKVNVLWKWPSKSGLNDGPKDMLLIALQIGRWAPRIDLASPNSM